MSARKLEGKALLACFRHRQKNKNNVGLNGIT
jgi:hypothetical protein